MITNERWDCTKPGENPLDELHRALYSVDWVVSWFTRIAESWLYTRDVPDEERAGLRKELIDQTRTCWGERELAHTRAHRALLMIDLKPFELEKREIRDALGELHYFFKRPKSTLDHETAGDHLILSDAGPLAY